MIALALILAFAGMQDGPWQKVGEVQGITLEITNVRAKGDIRDALVRASKGGHAMAYAVTIDCKAKTTHSTGDISVYDDGKLTSTEPFPDGMGGEQPYAPDPIAAPVAAFVCPK